MAAKSPRGKQTTGESFRSILFAIAIALTLRWGLAEAYVIPSGSMQPTLLIHDHIFINKLVYGIRIPFSKLWLTHFRSPKRGEVIVFKSPRDGINLIKRVIGVPGDRLRYEDTKLYINDKLIDEVPPEDMAVFEHLNDEDMERPKSDHVLHTEILGDVHHPVMHLIGNSERPQPEVTIPPDSLFMMGDHRDNSADSRYWGFAPVDNVLGKAMFVWLSCDKSIWREIGCNPLTIRWYRFFHHVK